MAKLTFSLVANSKLATSFKVNSTHAASWDFSVISRTPTFENNSEQLLLFKPEKLIFDPSITSFNIMYQDSRDSRNSETLRASA